MSRLTYLPAFLEVLHAAAGPRETLEGSLRYLVERFGFSCGLAVVFRPVPLHAVSLPAGAEPALDAAGLDRLCDELERMGDLSALLDAGSELRLDLLLGRLLGRRVEEHLLFPLVVMEGVAGFLGLCQDGRPPLSEEERSFLSIMVRQVQLELARERALWKERLLAGEGAALLEAGRAIISELDLDEVLSHIAAASLHALGVSRCMVFLFKGEEGLLELAYASDLDDPAVAFLLEARPRQEELGEGGRIVHEEGETILVDDAWEDPRLNHGLVRAMGIRSMLGVPVIYQGEVIGSILTDEPGRRHRFSEEDVRVMEGIAAFAAIAIENARLYRESREQQERTADLMLRLARVREEERSRISRELHDSMAQTLLEIIYKAEALLGSGPDERLRRELEVMLASSRSSLSELRRIITDLRPSSVEVLGLTRALASLLDRFAVTYRVEVEQDLEAGLEPGSLYENSIYRMVQEALNNVSRHASASRVRVSLRRAGGRIRLEVSDDGAGFDPASAPHRGGLGLASMRERAETMGGSFEVESAPGRGTTIRVEVPPGRDPGPGREG